ncbi:hypothetical protein [uncultured Methanobrevibacter sp.]|nr:hypothetical protein [uncultured Methanobrevibacter sp.]
MFSKHSTSTIVFNENESCLLKDTYMQCQYVFFFQFLLKIIHHRKHSLK